MRVKLAVLAVMVIGMGAAGCTPEWAKANSTPFIMEIAGIAPGDSNNYGSAIRSDVSVGGTLLNDDAKVLVNIFRKNNSPGMGVSPVEHIYLERYEVRYFRTDGRNQEGVDVPFRISGPLGNVRFHTPEIGGDGEKEAEVLITIVRHQAKAEPPLRNLVGGKLGDSGAIQFPGSGVITTIAEITIHGRTVQGQGLEAKGNVQVTFADFADE